MCISENSGRLSDAALVHLLTRTMPAYTADQRQDNQELPRSPEHFVHFCALRNTSVIRLPVLQLPMKGEKHSGEHTVTPPGSP